MRAECECGIRHRVTSAHCGRTIRCGCGKIVTVPSLRQLRLSGAEYRIVERFDDPQHWQRNGCFLCDDSVDSQVDVRIQLEAPVYDIVETGPARPSVPIIQVVLGTIFGRSIGRVAAAAANSGQQTERVLRSEGRYVDCALHFCPKCRGMDDLLQKSEKQLTFDTLFQELREDYPNACIVNRVS